MKHEKDYILLVEDNRADAALVREALATWRTATHLTVFEDGDQALHFLRGDQEHSGALTPDLVFLDLNLPRKDGTEFLRELKNDEKLAAIPVIVMTTSDRERDVRGAYRLHANCYMTKTLELNDFIGKMKAVEDFWLHHVRLPDR